jgi:hypothetical protein
LDGIDGKPEGFVFGQHSTFLMPACEQLWERERFNNAQVPFHEWLFDAYKPAT